MILCKIKDYYSSQPWYNKDIYKFIKSSNRHIRGFGTDCKFENLRTGKIINRWDSDFEQLEESESIRIWREYSINQI